MQPIRSIDLTTGEVGNLEIPPEWTRDFLGGGSLAARILYDVLTPDLDPLSPQAPLLFLNGPLSGTAGPAVGRFVVCGKSPYTGIWGESNCGGFWGPELRKAGFDGLLITGRAAEPVYLWIVDNKVEIRPARHLWGLDTYSTQAAVLKELGQEAAGASVAVIGPAGERLIPFSLILTDHGRVAGRTGMGAVMGSKNIKAIAVRGHGKVPVVDLSRYASVRAESNRNLRNDAMSAVLRELGTAGAAEYMDYLGLMPKKYFHAEVFQDATHISGANLSEKLLVGVSACHACVIACGRVVRLPEAIDPLQTRRKGPEYETLVGFGPNLWLNDLVFATRMGELCDRYGFDTISMSGTIGLAFLLYEKGMLNSQDTGGLELTWGNSEAVEELVHQTANRRDFGAHLAEGSRLLGRWFGAEEEAVQVKGLELAYHDPRGASGMAMVYATSPIGASHNQSDYFFVDLGQVDHELGLEFHSRLGGAEKAPNVVLHQNWRTVFNSLVLCVFSNISPDTVLELVNSACGYQWDLEDLLRCGDRGWNLKRAINNRLGIRVKDDTLPKIMQQPYPDNIHGPDVGFAPDFECMMSAYYAVRSWDPVTGLPTRQRLEELGLNWVADDLDKLSNQGG
jgi:aldehyde:ferredoxin oxidoreductase